MSFVGNDVTQINVVSNLAMYICVLNISMRSAFIKPNLLVTTTLSQFTNVKKTGFKTCFLHSFFQLLRWLGKPLICHPKCSPMDCDGLLAFLSLYVSSMHLT